jgi:hypothetical protein
MAHFSYDGFSIAYQQRGRREGPARTRRGARFEVFDEGWSR